MASSKLKEMMHEVFTSPPIKSLRARGKGGKEKQREQLIAIAFSKARRGY